MNKQEFIDYVAKQHSCTKVEAERNIDMFTSSVIGAMGENNEISLIGFGHFSIGKASGDGRAIFLATRSLFTFVVVTLFVLAYDVMDKTIKYCGS